MSDLLERVNALRAAGDVEQLAALVPYAQLIGVRMTPNDGDERQLDFHLPFREDLIGSPSGGHLHGGVMAAFLEHAAIVQMLWDGQSRYLPRIINFAVDYLRPGEPQTLYAAVDIRKQGRRVANVHASAWQASALRPVAVARGHFLLTPPDGGECP